MGEYELWKYLHLLMFVFWLGTDMGVFICAKKSTDPRYSFETRITLLTTALWIELLPRTMWKAALPLGAMLSMELGLLQLSVLQITLLWLFSIAWWAISVGSVVYGEQPLGPKLGRINNVLIGIVGVSLIVFALVNAGGTGPFEPSATWLLWKVGLFGLVNLMILVMLLVFEPMGEAFGRLAVEGSKPEIEQTIKAVMNRSIVTIWSTYLMIAFIAFIGVTKIL
ncbi:MAG: hypothetical protein JJT85_05045 [Chromatiales bacterium]|nr:hypothetical protein [Chromatiales bacterium]